MRIHPTALTRQLTLVGIGLCVVGGALGRGLWVGWAASILFGLQLARALTLYSVSRVRTAGLEMLWAGSERHRRAYVSDAVTVHAEVRNRDSRATRFDGLRVLHSPHLRIHVAVPNGEVPAGGSLRIEICIEGTRVGRHGVFGLQLNVQAGPGLFAVPLTFQNPFGLEVVAGAPAQARSVRSSGRALVLSESSAASQHGGDIMLKELREYSAGDPFRRIAWKASARRGKLMSKEFELEKQIESWILVSAAVELWSGASGDAPLDYALQHAAGLLDLLLHEGDHVGLQLLGHRLLSSEKPARGSRHRQRLLEMLSFESGLADSDRSGYDSSDLAALVAEHAAPLEAQGEPLAAHARPMTERTRRLLPRAPFEPLPFPGDDPSAPLRRYANAFGLPEAGRLEADGPLAQQSIARALRNLAEARRATPVRVFVIAPAPAPASPFLLETLRVARRRRLRVHWWFMPQAPTRAIPSSGREAALFRAAQWSEQAKRASAGRVLARAGVVVDTPNNTGRKRRRPPLASGQH